MSNVSLNAETLISTLALNISSARVAAQLSKWVSDKDIDLEDLRSSLLNLRGALETIEGFLEMMGPEVFSGDDVLNIQPENLISQIELVERVGLVSEGLLVDLASSLQE